MTGPDDEFEDFLDRRKPLFRRPTDEMGEPPAELDRLVLRQAREAIEPAEPMRVFSAPRWSMPIALAATLVLAFTVIFKAGMPPKPAARPEVTVQNVEEPVNAPSAAAAQQQDVSASSGTAVVEVLQPAQSAREVVLAPPAEPMAARSVADVSSRRMAGASSTMEQASDMAPAPAAKAGDVPAWRRDSKSWQAEIQRLRDAGNNAAADAEYAEFKRQQRAYAVAPDR